MIRRSSESPDDADLREHLAAEPMLPEAQRIGRTHDELASARCPICRDFLVARLGRRGPYFFCGCTGKRAA